MRCLTPGASELLEEATARSSRVRSLVDALERTDIVVYLSDAMVGYEREPRCYLAFVAAAAGVRYVIVRLDRWRALPTERIALLGHELQHAHEIAGAPEVRDAAGMAELYRRIGWERGRGRFESDDARRTGTAVRDEMARRAAPR